MLRWDARPIEVAHLLNPAFGALLLHDAVVAYAKQKRSPMPFALVFLVLPLALHRRTREALPSTTATLLPQWLETHPELQALAAERMRRLSPYSREAILFGLQNGLLSLAPDGDLSSAQKTLRDPFAGGAVDPAACRKAAQFLGKWFGKVADPKLIFAFWGIRP
jgi:hypothetical protein